MRKPDSLNGLIAVRLRQEESEERTLASLGHQLRQARVRQEQIAADEATARSLRLEEVQHRADGAHHHRWEVRMKQMWQRLQDVATEIARLEGAYDEQMQRYLAARRAREIISELQQKYATR